MVTIIPRWVLWVIPAVFDFIAASIAARFLGGSSSEYWQSTIFLFLALLATQIAISIYGAIKHWMLFVIFDRERITRHFNRSLHQKDMPRSLPFEGTLEYLSRVQSDERIPLPQRLDAAFTLGEFSGIKSARPLTSYFMLLLGFDRALRRYD